MAKDRFPVYKAAVTASGVAIALLFFAMLWLIAEPFIVLLLWVFWIPFILSLLSGLVRGLVFNNWKTFRFAWKIFEGNFIVEENSSYIQGVKTLISRLIWEQPQTMLGNFGMQTLNSVWLIKRVDIWKRALVCQGVFLRGGGIALGSFIMIDLQSSPVFEIFPMDERTIPEKILVRHEYGHTLQSVSAGPLFIFKYGIPSILMQGWTEPDADYRSDMDHLHKNGIMPVFFNHREQRRVISPEWWEFASIPLFLAAGWVINDANGMTGSILFTMVLTAVINLKQPACRGRMSHYKVNG